MSLHKLFITKIVYYIPFAKTSYAVSLEPAKIVVSCRNLKQKDVKAKCQG